MKLNEAKFNEKSIRGSHQMVSSLNFRSSLTKSEGIIRYTKIQDIKASN